MKCTSIIGSDKRMDCANEWYEPINALPIQCDTCGFPDLDYVPQPYYLVKSKTKTANEFAVAEKGNFLVRDRVKKVLEAVAPNQCEYYPTTFRKTTETTP